MQEYRGVHRSLKIELKEQLCFRQECDVTKEIKLCKMLSTLNQLKKNKINLIGRNK